MLLAIFNGWWELGWVCFFSMGWILYLGFREEKKAEEFINTINGECECEYCEYIKK